MYEIWSLGHEPFEGYTNLEVKLTDNDPTFWQLVLTTSVLCISLWRTETQCRRSTRLTNLYHGLPSGVETHLLELCSWVISR